MTQYHRLRSRRRQPQRPAPRTKRPLVILTYRDNHFESIHTSTPQVQFVRIDFDGFTSTRIEAAEIPIPGPGRVLTVGSFAELPETSRIAAQQAFRRSK